MTFLIVAVGLLVGVVLVSYAAIVLTLDIDGVLRSGVAKRPRDLTRVEVITHDDVIASPSVSPVSEGASSFIDDDDDDDDHVQTFHNDVCLDSI